MAGLVRFSEAMSSRVSDCRLNSLRMSWAMSGSSLSRARKDIVVTDLLTRLMLSALQGRRPQQLRRRDRAFAQHTGLGTGEVENRGRGAAGRDAAVQDGHHAR